MKRTGNQSKLDESAEKSSSMAVIRFEPATPRELQCLGLVTKGLETKQIARLLRIAPGTVDNHIKQTMRIYKVQDRHSAAALAWSEILTADGLPGLESPLDDQSSGLDSLSPGLPDFALTGAVTTARVREEPAADDVTHDAERWLPEPFKPLVRRAGEGNTLSPGERGLLIFKQAMAFVAMFILLVVTLLAFGLANSWMHSP